MNDGGRLGNKMCQYLSLYLLRHIFGIRVSITQNMNANLRRVFENITLSVRDPACFTSNTTNIHYNDLYQMLFRAVQRSTNVSSGSKAGPLLTKSYYVRNNPCPRDLLLAYRDLLKHLLVFKKEVIMQANHNINVALSRLNRTRHDVTLVTVHVRRTDYIRYMKRRMNISALDELYFQRAFDFYRRRVPRPAVFVVVSDDLKWCKKLLTTPDVVLAGSRSPAVDQAVLSLGDHIVTSYGTFSYMGAILSNGHITHPINSNPRYTDVYCIKSMDFHLIPRDREDPYNSTNTLP